MASFLHLRHAHIPIAHRTTVMSLQNLPILFPFWARPTKKSNSDKLHYTTPPVFSLVFVATHSAHTDFRVDLV